MNTTTLTRNETTLPACAELQFGELAVSRARIYGILSAACSGLPGEQLVRLFSSWEIPEPSVCPPGMRRGLRRMKSWAEKHGSDSAQLSALESEFTRLFRGLGRMQSPPPPYESVYVDGGLVFGASTQRVAAAYRRFGVTGRDNEPPDYIALELDFMRLLCEKEARAWQDGDGVPELVKEEADFLAEHLAQWVPDFCKNVRQFHTNSFYSGLADAIEGWLKYDRGILEGLARL